MSLEFNSEGARIGIAEHNQKIERLVEEESEITQAATEGRPFSQQRLDDIGQEIIRRKKEKDKLQKGLDSLEKPKG
ncbi:hypothetical protein [Rahnella sp. Larv3_ips]|uniref:hypothetical protein n=1 Tax=Rahnella sp. Larv3_ips TaxID=1896943 RepID=UPI000EFB650E|nr:hypothetical protein [Rahnella sp. Larv3_ips]